jgi:rRNA-processing protein FCF1
MKLIDTNALVVLLLGLIDPKLINSNRRTSIYEEQDFHDIILTIGQIENLIVLPNVWTETDNLLNNSIGHQKFKYIENIKYLVNNTTELYLKSASITNHNNLFELGITDSLLLSHAVNCELLITSDSTLADHARAIGVSVFDVVKNRNSRHQ